jgi:hypothetical protein
MSTGALQPSILILISLILPSSKALCIYSGNVQQSLKASSDIKNVADYEDPTDPQNKRMTEREYAEVNKIPLEPLQRAVSATGSIRCGKDMLATANIVDSVTVTTNAHVLMDLNTCAEIAKASSCRFFRKVGDVEYSDSNKPIPPNLNREAIMRLGVPVDPSFVKMGLRCPSAPLVSQDWLVLKLKHPILDVQPYSVAALPNEAWAHKALFKVSSVSVDFRGPNGSFPKSVANCHQNDSELFGDGGFLLYTNCGLGAGGSGSAALLPYSPSSPPVMIAMVTDYSLENDAAAYDKEMSTQKPIKRAYDAKTWRTGMIPVRGEFLDAILLARSPLVSN